MTHYEILGIRKTASTDEIKNAYKKLVKKYHPDVYVGDKSFAEKKIKEINEAYDVLSNPEQKREYDELINPQTTTYNPKDYSSYTYSAPNYGYSASNYSYKTSKRNAQARDSKYSYENYRKTCNSTNYGSYDYQKRYTDYHRSKTPNSTYSENGPSNSYAEKIAESLFNFSDASKSGVLTLIIFLFIIFFIINLMQIVTFFDNSDSLLPSTSSNTNNDSKKTYGIYEDDNSYIPKKEFDQTNPYLESEESINSNKDNQKYEEGVIPPLEDFDINLYFTDDELMEAYLSYGNLSYSSFEEFKAAVAEAFYKTYILYY